MTFLPAELQPYALPFLTLAVAWSLAVILYDGAVNRRDPWLVWVRGLLLLAAVLAAVVLLPLLAR